MNQWHSYTNTHSHITHTYTHTHSYTHTSFTPEGSKDIMLYCYIAVANEFY